MLIEAVSYETETNVNGEIGIRPRVFRGWSVAAAMLAHAGDGAVGRVRAVEKALYSSGSYDGRL